MSARIREAKRLLNRPGDLMHAAWIVARELRQVQAEVYRQHHKSGRKARRSVVEINALAKSAHGHTGRYSAVWAACSMLVGAAADRWAGTER